MLCPLGRMIGHLLYRAFSAIFAIGGGKRCLFIYDEVIRRIHWL